MVRLLWGVAVTWRSTAWVDQLDQHKQRQETGGRDDQGEGAGGDSKLFVGARAASVPAIGVSLTMFQLLLQHCGNVYVVCIHVVVLLLMLLLSLLIDDVITLSILLFNWCCSRNC